MICLMDRTRLRHSKCLIMNRYDASEEVNFAFLKSFIIIICIFVLDMNLNDSYGKDRFYRK